MIEKREIKNAAERIGRQINAEQVILFGSHARGEATDYRDVDLLTRQKSTSGVPASSRYRNRRAPLPLIPESCALQKWWRRRESNPKAAISETDTSDTKPTQNLADQCGNDSDECSDRQKPHTSTHIPHTSLHLKRVPEEYQHIPADLAKVVSAWTELSEDAKRRIVEIAEGGL